MPPRLPAQPRSHTRTGARSRQWDAGATMTRPYAPKRGASPLRGEAVTRRGGAVDGAGPAGQAGGEGRPDPIAPPRQSETRPSPLAPRAGARPSNSRGREARLYTNSR
ncbi:hypothetical protein GCM10018785_14940 [Streptomyces longispororuber]|uniref:Uncharacterized protein n=1 Tax=Streptomyces longispororuber TaxID=68230 RepID=A0A918ZDU1_9ACTN|nr:hypothetical protein GCM10018785_14940 [Streptomyces longispororuber]